MPEECGPLVKVPASSLLCSALDFQMEYVCLSSDPLGNLLAAPGQKIWAYKCSYLWSPVGKGRLRLPVAHLHLFGLGK